MIDETDSGNMQRLDALRKVKDRRSDVQAKVSIMTKGSSTALARQLECCIMETSIDRHSVTR